MVVGFEALGGFGVTVDGVAVSVGGARQRRLLAALLIHRNSVVSADRLADAVFAGTPTPGSHTTLRSYVARLRRVLHPAADGANCLVTQPPGYLLRVADDAFDVARLETAVACALDLLERDQPAAAAGTLRRVAPAWRGDPYSEFADEPWIQPEVHRLGELQLVAQETLFDAELACGRHAELIPELEIVAARHPLREGVRWQLVLALYRSGRQADALAALREHRKTLREELGLDPSTALVELEASILSHDRTLLSRAAGSAIRG